MNKQSWSPGAKAARVHRTAYLGGLCFTERKYRSSTEGPCECLAEGKSVLSVRKLPLEPSERTSGAAPAAPTAGAGASSPHPEWTLGKVLLKV